MDCKNNPLPFCYSIQDIINSVVIYITFLYTRTISDSMWMLVLDHNRFTKHFVIFKVTRKSLFLGFLSLSYEQERKRRSLAFYWNQVYQRMNTWGCIYTLMIDIKFTMVSNVGFHSFDQNKLKRGFLEPSLVLFYFLRIPLTFTDR